MTNDLLGERGRQVPLESPQVVRTDPWIQLPESPAARLDEVAGRLTPNGITVGDRLSLSCCVYQPRDGSGLMKEVGEVVLRDDASVLVLPRADATDQEVIALLQAGALAERPSEQTGWERRSAGTTAWWQHTLLLPVDDRDRYARAYRAAEAAAELAERESAAIAVGE